MKSLLQPVDSGAKVDSLSDSQILVLSLKNPDVFKVLMERWRPRLFARAARLMGNPEDAEDVVQETLVRMYKYAHGYQEHETGGFSGWVYTIFYNVAKTYQRRRQQRSVYVSSSQLLAEEAIEFPDSGDQNLFERFLDVDQVASVLTRLPRTVARLLRLHILEGKSNQELAETEGVSIGAIRVRLHRARQSFQQALHRDKKETVSAR